MATEQIGGRVLAATRQITAIIPKLTLLIQIPLVGAVLGLSWSRNWGGGGAAWEGCRWGRGEDRGAVRLLTALIGWVFHQGAVAGKLGVSWTLLSTSVLSFVSINTFTSVCTAIIPLLSLTVKDTLVDTGISVSVD